MTTADYSITGMTCGHCVASVTEEIGEVPGVTDVQVDLVAGGTSTARVSAEGPVDDAAVRAAIAEAGYDVVEG
ncbi:heavy-metal-associated domain-containing protein [Micrococcus cohnii]|uniref:Copper chaperone CopZ n=1 Tax=Micrococcus cohnii TaxID=993416 RepID=A0A7W7GPS7_9MICC|nr:heavy-metal-associated domain-containing protein [Micrococcus cohnii]MBB4736055.1 copper chaperone CopZ [Micrococcus cohnii]